MPAYRGQLRIKIMLCSVQHWKVPTIDPSKGTEKAAEATEDTKPSFHSAIRVLRWVHRADLLWRSLNRYMLVVCVNSGLWFRRTQHRWADVAFVLVDVNHRCIISAPDVVRTKNANVNVT